MLMITILSLTIGRDLYLGAEPNVVSFGITHFAGYLFFLVMPVEGLYIYYLTEFLDPVQLTVIAITTALLAQTIDYYCGYLVSERAIQYFISRDKYVKAQGYIKKYGNATILVFNLFPLSSPIIVLASGMLKYPFRKVLLFSFIGLLIKYGVTALFFM